MIVVPGQDITDLVEENDVKVLGGGISREEDGRVIATLAGPLFGFEEHCWVARNATRCLPMKGDFVIGVVTEVLGEGYLVDIAASRLANLDALAFDGATRRNCPNLGVGAVIFARVSRCEFDTEPVITCEALDGEKRKDWTSGESQFGELKGGLVFPVSPATCRRLSQTDCPLLQVLGKAIPFEACVGLNGRMWLAAEDEKDVVLIRGAIVASQGKNLNSSQSNALVKELIAQRLESVSH